MSCFEEFDMSLCGNKNISLPNVGELNKLKNLKMQGNVPAGFDRLKALTHLYVQDGEVVSTWLSNALRAFTMSPN